MMLEPLLRVAMASIATVGFCVLFHVPRKELWTCGIVCAAGWLCYEAVRFFWVGSVVGASFAAAVAIAVCARVMSYLRKSPVIIYLVGGIIPIVPGAGIYYTMYEGMINGNTLLSLEKGIETLKIAGVIAAGIFVVLSLPHRLFDWRRNK